MKRLVSGHGLPLLLAAAMVGCSSLETSVTRPDDQPATMEMFVEVPGTSSSGSVTPAARFNVTVEGDQGNRLDISQALVVLDQVEFRRASGEGCEPSDDPTADDGDACAEVVVQPSVLELPVDQGQLSAANVAVEAGTYEALEFDVHVVTPEDVDIVGEFPSLVESSVQLRGSFDDGTGGTALDSAVFAPEGRVQLELDEPIELDDGTTGRMTLTVDVASWFRDGDTVLDPSQAARDTTLARQVAERIMVSFSVRPGG